MGDDRASAPPAIALFTPTVARQAPEALAGPQWLSGKSDVPLIRVHLSVTPFVPPRHPVGP